MEKHNKSIQIVENLTADEQYRTGADASHRRLVMIRSRQLLAAGKASVN